ncbi:hypothetical protein CDL12_07546 [Handroanthus impetiginosus]|uniref:C2H2-type domain-containing protein n=1 Tax=Handroanthus impetiginosus TaxID=429701 RepID=A0A2G9HQF8_9LAMI|nr:hypothetical protein CDL12_07546 [Handroanthus impetiginosus]
MAFVALNTPPPPSAVAQPTSLHRKDKAVPDRFSDEEYNIAECLLMLSRSGPTLTIPAAFHPPAEEDRYKCSMCSKVFRSHQALGGHKTSHRHKPPLAAAMSPRGPELNIRVHKCCICHKSFRRGQALGGHMRKHHEGLISVRGKKVRNISEGVTTSSCVTSSYGGATNQSGGDVTPVRRTLDLYLPPPTGLDLTLHL